MESEPEDSSFLFANQYNTIAIQDSNSEKSEESPQPPKSKTKNASGDSSKSAKLLDDDLLDDYEEGVNYPPLEDKYSSSDFVKSNFQRRSTGKSTSQKTIGIPENLLTYFVGKHGKVQEIQESTNCSVQISIRSLGPDVDRPCILSGTDDEIIAANSEIEKIIDEHTPIKLAAPAGGGQWTTLEPDVEIIENKGNPLQSMSSKKNITEFLNIPTNRCSIVVGSNGMMIKYLREKFNVEIQIIKNRANKSNPTQPCKFIGDAKAVANAKDAVANLVGIAPAERPPDKQDIARMAKAIKSGSKVDSEESDEFIYTALPQPRIRVDDGSTEVFVCKQSVDMITGSNGTVINQIMSDTNTMVEWVPDDPKLYYRSCLIKGSPVGVQEAINKIKDIDRTVQRTMPRNDRKKNTEDDEEKQWEIALPISKVGAIIGKRAEHLKSCTRQTGVKIEIDNVVEGSTNGF